MSACGLLHPRIISRIGLIILAFQTEAVTTFARLKVSKKKLITNHNMKYQNYLPASRKEVFQPHLPVRLPCYDLAPVTDFTLKRDIPRSLGTADSHGLTGGVYKARERIHRAMADARLLANPASWSRVTDSNPN